MPSRFPFIAFVLFALPALAQQMPPGWIRDGTTGCRVWNLHPRPDETIRWSGACTYGLAQGRGVLQWIVNGELRESDEGEFRGGKGQGWFVTISTDGYRYEGERRDSERHGRGTATFANGDRYEGEWREDNYDGRGTFVWASGTRYEGEWQNGKPNGWGKATYAWDGSVYEGIWTNGCFQQGNRRWALFATTEECRFK
jgi:hypothetical protein